MNNRWRLRESLLRRKWLIRQLHPERHQTKKKWRRKPLSLERSLKRHAEYVKLTPEEIRTEAKEIRRARRRSSNGLPV